jgi:hypothetical protein
MLPDFAHITLHEESCNLFGELNSCEELSFGTLDRWTTWIVLGTADATDSLVLLILEVFVVRCSHLVVVNAGSTFGVFFYASFSSSRKKSVFEIVWRFGGE